MMPSNLLLWGGAVVLCSMASPILCFSHGASLTSCQEMIPGHIRAHPLDPKHSFITLQTSSSSYLPGQLITVTVRSSRDFMGFLLQARSVGGQRNGFAEGPGIRTERLGPLLVGGSWIRSPPGTHTLRCLFEGDTVTHSDKQLKRNLSFVWRAPDMPKGDIRFHITVVQSYFVYWTGVESAVVRDRSPSAWRRSKTKMTDGESTIFAVQETVTAQTANRKATLASFSGRPSNIKNATEILKFLKVQTKDDHATLETNSSVTWTTQTVAARRTLTSGSPQSTTNESPGFLAGMTKGITTELFSYTTVFPLPSSPPDTTYTVTTTQFPLASFSTSNPPVPLQTDTWTKSNNLQIKSQELKLKNNPGGKRYKTFTAIPTQGPTVQTFFSAHTPVSHTLTDPNKNKSRKSETSSSSEKLGGNVPSNSQMRVVKTEVTPSYQRSSFNSSRFHMAADLKSQTDTSQTSVGPTKQTSSPKKTIPNVHQTLPISLQGENSQFDSTTESFRPFSQPLSQTTRVFSQPTVTPQPVTVSSGGNDPTSEGNTKTMAPVVGFVSSNTSSSFSASNSSRSFASRRSENFTLVTSISSIHSPSRPSQNEPKTTPNHSVPASPSPISIPHHLTSAEYQTSTPPTSSSSPSASNYPTMPSSPTSISPTFSSSTPSFSVTSPSLRVSSSSFISPITSPKPEPTSASHKTPNSETRLTSPAHRKVVHPNPKPYPNLRPNHDQEINPNIQNTDTKPKHPSDPADAPDKEGKYPDIVPRHSAWELGMLLGCSAGLGMVLVVGLRYVYRQACGRRTEVTLNDREREYGRGEQGLVHLQECGDLVRVRKIRENSFVLLAEYDILASTSN
ncbi:PREDICTED: mucin-5AC-like [Poecilia mexicana]|uniref:Reelin domain-containing protein n=1 Tax=Poecilia mexicana TaxID=48701 RepID=A0A3B3WZB2_9TELE|nr:PREDICTED: mucin-5AC-like [Poecilia mexicana]